MTSMSTQNLRKPTIGKPTEATKTMAMSQFDEPLKSPDLVADDTPPGSGGVGHWLRRIGLGFVFVGMLGVLGLLTGVLRWPGQPPVKPKSASDSPALLAVELVPGKPHTLSIPEEVRQTLGIRKNGRDLLAVARIPSRGFELVMPGSTMLDPGRIMRIRARFAPSPSSAEVVQIAQRIDDRSAEGETTFREIRSGDRVTQGEVLAVFYSVDVGNKKNDLADAIFQRKLDQEILNRAEKVRGSVPEVFLLNQYRAVEGDLNAINRAVNTLRTWGIPEEDIKAVQDEAENSSLSEIKARQEKKQQGKLNAEKIARWARVEIKAPDDGVIIERNVSLHEIVVDNTTNLFQIAKVDQLQVIANVPEDDLPALQSLPTLERRWSVRTVGTLPVGGAIDDIGYIIDPNQHTAVVKGHIDNPHGVLRAGQFITATVQLPPPADVVEVPMDTIVDDGQQSLVFVQSDLAKPYFTMRRVVLAQRFEKTAFVRSKLAPGEEELTVDERGLGLLPKAPLHRGERLLQTGVGELKAALLEKESQPKSQPQAK